jgi:hypothetical protein
MNRWLDRLRGLENEKGAPSRTLKTLKTAIGVGFDGFEGTRGTPFSENEMGDREAVKHVPPLPQVVRAVLDRWPGSVITAVRFGKERTFELFDCGFQPAPADGTLTRHSLHWLTDKVLSMQPEALTEPAPAGCRQVEERKMEQVDIQELLSEMVQADVTTTYAAEFLEAFCRVFGGNPNNPHDCAPCRIEPAKQSTVPRQIEQMRRVEKLHRDIVAAKTQVARLKAEAARFAEAARSAEKSDTVSP